MHSKQQEYVYLSDNTRGQIGRPIKVHMEAAIYLYCTIELDTYLGQQVIRDLESLRSTIELTSEFNVPHKKADKKRDDVYATLKRLRNAPLSTSIGSVSVSFYYEQKAGDKVKTVYISSIRIIGKGSSYAPGVYQRSSRGQVTRMEKPLLRGKAVFVSGANAEKPGLQIDRANKLLGSPSDLAVFYTPQDVGNDIGPWKNGKMSRITDATVKELKSILQNNQASQVSWYVEQEGAGILMHAIEGTKLNLKGHDFKIVDSHASNTPKLLQKLSEANADFSKGDAVDYTDMNNDKGMLGLARQVDNLCNQVGNLSGYQDYAIISRRYLIQGIQTKGRLGAQVLSKISSINSSKSSLVSILRRRG